MGAILPCHTQGPVAFTPFHLAAARGHIDLVDMFLEAMTAMRRSREEAP